MVLIPITILVIHVAADAVIVTAQSLLALGSIVELLLFVFFCCPRGLRRRLVLDPFHPVKHDFHAMFHHREHPQVLHHVDKGLYRVRIVLKNLFEVAIDECLHGRGIGAASTTTTTTTTTFVIVVCVVGRLIAVLSDTKLVPNAFQRFAGLLHSIESEKPILEEDGRQLEFVVSESFLIGVRFRHVFVHSLFGRFDVFAQIREHSPAPQGQDPPVCVCL
mmetsp:Transcript_28858/g.78176  ORF Transcript_28858/g.78176 Transcript_28858/m.78176 type:complete len:219 (-) Transcript_28858:501-1157(-)